MKAKKFDLVLAIILILAALWLAACGGAPMDPAQETMEVPVAEEAQASAEQAAPTQPPQPTATTPPTPTAEPPTATPEPPTATPGLPALPPEPQALTFQAEDGRELQGTYYPAAVNPAPVVVFMHWAGGDQNDWVEIAYWLQNRGLGGQGEYDSVPPWLDPRWFPEIPEGQSYAVFAFTFRECEGGNGCQNFLPDKWLLDAQAAMTTARSLEGVEPTRVASIGASIGADGAPDGCGWLNAEGEGGCVGALSLSPGAYLTIPYNQAVTALESLQPPLPAWCLYGENDQESARACESAQGTLYQTYKYSGDPHGMVLIQPDLDHDTLQLILDFLKLTFGE